MDLEHRIRIVTRHSGDVSYRGHTVITIITSQTDCIRPTGISRSDWRKVTIPSKTSCKVTNNRFTLDAVKIVHLSH